MSWQSRRIDSAGRRWPIRFSNPEVRTGRWRCRGGFLLAAMVSIAGMVLSGHVLAITPPETLSHFEQTIHQTIDSVRPAVVRITAIRMHLDVNTVGTEQQAVPFQSVGSGVIVDPRGYVITNAHVVQEAQYISAHLLEFQQTVIPARLVDSDEELDLAILQLQTNNVVPYANLGSSKTFHSGDWAIAIGSPYGLDHSVSMGIVSDTSRTLWINGRTYKDLIQTDAAINQGNSGGALVNLEGQVIGINTAIYAPNGISTGIGFAIPASRAMIYAAKIIPRREAFQLAATVGKEPIRLGAKPPHPAAGKCTACHVFTGTTSKSKPALSQTVAAVTPMTAPSPQSSTGYFRPEQFAPDPHIDLTPKTLPRNEKGDQWRIISRATGLVLAAAALFNMLGIGGGFAYVPILLFFGTGFHLASATSLFIISSAHLSALHVFIRSRLVDYRLAMVVEPITAVGSFLGGITSDKIGETPLTLMFGILLITASVLMYRCPETKKTANLRLFNSSVWYRTFGKYRYSIDLTLCLPLAFAVGVVGGMLGFAGGWLKIPMLVLLFGVPMKVAIATSSLMVAATSLVGCIGHGIAGHFSWGLSIPLAIAGIAGAQIGARLTLGSHQSVLKRLFSFVLFTVALLMLGRLL